jgi:acyl CoA:acetate/3-ketoacid CoA transferase alpha subunit
MAISPPHIEVLDEGIGEFRMPDPDGYREWVRDHKSRALVSKLMTAQEAVSRFVEDGDYLCYDCNYLQRGPSALIREVIRQKKKDLWVAGKFTWVAVHLLLAGGCASKVDCGFFLFGKAIDRFVQEGKVQIFEYSNVVMTLRLQAGAMGLPFLPVRSFGGTDGFHYSGAKLIRDPYTGQPITIVPALNPDVALIHVQQADTYGNARVFGTGIAHQETAMASKKVIISTEEIIDAEEIRRDPGRTSIPYYCVDAVVQASFGAYPGECTGYYASDPPGVIEVVVAALTDNLGPYLDKYVYSVANDQEMLEKQVGLARLLDMQRRVASKEGYRP